VVLLRIQILVEGVVVVRCRLFVGTVGGTAAVGVVDGSAAEEW